MSTLILTIVVDVIKGVEWEDHVCMGCVAMLNPSLPFLSLRRCPAHLSLSLSLSLCLRHCQVRLSLSRCLLDLLLVKLVNKLSTKNDGYYHMLHLFACTFKFSSLNCFCFIVMFRNVIMLFGFVLWSQLLCNVIVGSTYYCVLIFKTL